jgi:xyloglucan-specific exo-beta-1,4-glucanase
MTKRNILLAIALLFLACISGKTGKAQVIFSDENEMVQGKMLLNDPAEENKVTYEGIVGQVYGRLRSIAFDAQNEGVAYASNYQRQIFKSTDHGQTWEYYYSAPIVPGFPTRVTNLRFANPNEPTHLYFVVGDGSSNDVSTRGIYIMDTSNGEIINVISNVYFQHLNYADYDIDPLNPNNIIVLGSMGIWFEANYPGSSRNTVWRSTNGGEDFEMIYDYADFNELSARTVTIHPGNPNTLLLGMGGSPGDDEGGFFGTIDGGQNWIRITEGDIIGDVAMVPGDPSRLFAVTGFGAEEEKILRTVDGGFTWTALDVNLTPGSGSTHMVTLAIDPSNSDIVWATNTNEILKTEDGGDTWVSTVFEQDTYHTYRYGSVIAVNPFNSDHVIISSDKRVVQTMDRGQTWEVMPIRTMEFFTVDAVKYPDGSEYLYYTANGSYFAENIQTGEINEHLALHAVNQNYFIFGDKYTQDVAFLAAPQFTAGIKVFRTDDNFATPPTEVYSGSGRVLTKVERAPENEDIYWMIIPQGPSITGPAKLVRTMDGFETTEDISITGNTEAIMDIQTVEGQPGVLWAYAASHTGIGVFKSTDYGDTWTSHSNGLPLHIGIWSLAVNQNNPDNIIAAVSENMGLYVTFDGGANWTHTFSEFECRQVIFSKTNPDVAFARRHAIGGLVYTEDGGQTWTIVPEEVGIDASYTRMSIIDQDGSVDIYGSTLGVNIIKYTYTAQQTFTLTFSVEDEAGDSIAEAVITLDGTSYDPGVYVFAELEPGTYAYIVEKEGYITYENEVTITDADINLVVVLEEAPELFAVTFNVDMTDAEGFDPESHAVYIAGNFGNDLSWVEPVRPASLPWHA